MVKIQLNAWEFDLPETWQECNLRQIAKLSPITSWKKEDITQAVEEYTICTLLKCGWKIWNDLTLQIEQWNALKKIARFAFETFIVERPFEYFDHEGERYYVFSEGFGDSDAVDFAWANLQYVSFANPDNPNLDAVNQLIATLCRPQRRDIEAFKLSKEWDGDTRELYNAQRVKDRAKKLESLDLGIKVALLQYFENQNRKFLEAYAQMFGEDSQEPRYDNGMGWVTMLMKMAEKGTFGNFDDVCRQNVHLVWAKCLDDTLDAKEENERLERERWKNEQN